MDAPDDFTLNVITNTELMAVNQDVKGTCAEPVGMDEMEWFLRKVRSDGSVVVGFFDVANAGPQHTSDLG